MLTNLDINNFNNETANGLKLIEFYANWCGHCKRQQFELNEMDKIWIGQIDVDKEKRLVSDFGIYSFPTFLVMKDGKEMERFSGFRTKEDLMNVLMKYMRA